MKKDNKELIPEHFASAEEAGDYWDVHDLADYWDETSEADVRFNLKSRHYLIGLAPEIAEELQKVAQAEGVSSQTIANLWLQEKLRERTRRFASTP